MSLGVWSVHAQDAPSARRALSVLPSASLTETLTDNVNLSSDKRADAITQASVGVRVSSNGGRLKGFFDYTLSGNVYARGSAGSNLQNALNASLTGELIPNRFYVDMSGSISQQSISAFGTQSTDSSLSNSNRTEVRTFAISPFLRGEFSPLFNYELRVNGSHSSSNSGSTSDVTNAGGLLHLGAGNQSTKFSGTLDVSRQSVDYSLGRRSEGDLVRGVLSYAVTPDLQMSAIGGRESNNYATVEKTSHSIVGAQVKWLPSTRTNVSARYERRFFGNSHAVDISYRTPRTAWIFSDSRDVNTGLSGLSAIGTEYDALYAALASIVPDPDQRKTLVLANLANRGLNPTSPRTSGFLTSGPTVQRQQSLSVALLGLRDTITFRYWNGTSSVLSGTDSFNAAPADGSAPSASSTVKQRGISADISRRLTPQSTLGIGGTWQQTSGDFAAQKSQLRSLTATYSQRLTRRIDAYAMARHASYSSPSSAYVENAVSASLRLQF